MTVSHGLNAASLALSFTSLVFFIVGTIAYTDQQVAIENTAWMYWNKDGAESYYGLRTMFAKFDAAGFKGSMRYEDAGCSMHFCDVCERAGRSTFGLTILGAIFATITLALSGVALVNYNKGVQIVNIFASFLSATFSLVAIGLFMSWCFDTIEDDVGTDDDGTSYGYDDDGFSGDINFKWGTGSILSTLGMLMMWVVVIFQITATVVGGRATPAPTTANTAEGAVVQM